MSRMRRADRIAAGVAVALLALGLAAQPVALRFDHALWVADACLPWPAEGDLPEDERAGERTWGFRFPAPPPDPWGRPWRQRLLDPAVDGRAVPVPMDPAVRDAPFVRGGPRWVVYSVGPDGVDDGGVAGPDVLLEVAALKRLIVTDVAAEAGAWLGGLVLLSWLLGRGAHRRRWLLVGLLPLVLAAAIGAARTVGRATYLLPTELPELPLVIPLEGAVLLSLLAVLGLVGGLGWTTSRAQVAGEGEGAAGG